jgi:prophage regulatory protein
MTRDDEILRLRKALHEAYRSLETVSIQAGRAEHMIELDEVRAYAASRARVAREALAEQSPREEERRPLQTVQSLRIPEAHLKIQTVIEVTGLSESSIRRRVAGGTFPAPTKDGPRCVRWIAGDISNWLRAKAVRA